MEVPPNKNIEYKILDIIYENLRIIDPIPYSLKDMSSDIEVECKCCKYKGLLDNILHYYKLVHTSKECLIYKLTNILKDMPKR